MQNFKKLRVWQLASALSVEMRNHFTPQRCSMVPGFRGDLLRAARSVPNNIAEGCGRSTVADQLRFFDISMGSLFEVENGLEEGKSSGIITPSVHDRLVSRVALTRRMLIGLRGKISDAEE